MIKKIILLLSMFFLGVYLLINTWSCLRCEYEKKLLQLQGVASIKGYVQHEDKLSVKLNLSNGGYLFIGSLNKRYFTNTHYLPLLQIGDIRIKCTNKLNHWYVEGFNLVTFINGYTDLENIKNIQDVINAYDEIYKEIRLFLYDSQAGSKEIILGSKILDAPPLILSCQKL